MAVLKFGSIVTEGSGSLSGHTIQKSFGGAQLRTKPIPTGKPSASQTLIRSYNPVLQAGWRALTSAQQKVWNDWPVAHGIFNAKGDKHPLSGHSLWMKWQFYRLIEKLPFLSDPSKYLSTYFGPELVTNGDFSSSSGWGFYGTHFSISGGKLIADNATASDFIYRNTPVVINKYYRYSTLIDSVLNGTFVFYCAIPALIFSSPGYFIKDVFTTNTDYYVYVQGDILCSAIIDSISIKEIYNY